MDEDLCKCIAQFIPYTSHSQHVLANTCSNLQGVHTKVMYILKRITMCWFEIDGDV